MAKKKCKIVYVNGFQKWFCGGIDVRKVFQEAMKIPRKCVEDDVKGKSGGGYRHITDRQAERIQRELKGGKP